jgi:colanic acid/amylovoran biosynthesis glycosyltransferase
MTGLIDRGHKISIFSFRNKDQIGCPNIEKYSLMNVVTYEKMPKKLPEYDIVFCQSASLGKKIIEIKKLRVWLRRRKLVVCLRGHDITQNDVRNNPDMYRDLFRKSALFLPVCDYFKKLVVQLGCNSNKVTVHHSAIDCSQFFFTVRQKPENDTIHFVSVGRLIKKKGIDYALRAFAQIAEKYQNTHYTIVGDGPEIEYLKFLVKQLDLQNKVTICGWKTQDEIVSILNKSHIFLLPSIRTNEGDEEGIANALKEAMATGLITIGSWHAGTPELIDHGISGFLVHEKNIPELMETIEYILEHPEIWEPMELMARKKVEDEFETKQCVEKLEKLFYQLLGY